MHFQDWAKADLVNMNNNAMIFHNVFKFNFIFQFSILQFLMKTFTLGTSKGRLAYSDRQIKIASWVQLGLCVTDRKSFCFETQCPHRKANLSQGSIKRFQEVICHLHEYRFDLKTGRVTSAIVLT